MRATLVTGKTVRGFTLLELLVVLAVLVLLTLAIPIALPRLAPAQQLRADAENLLSAFRAARERAVLSGVPVVLTLDATPGASDVVIENSQRVVWQAAYGDNVVWESTEGRAASRLTYYPDGSATGLTARLAMGKRSLEVSISAMTGRVSVQTP